MSGQSGTAGPISQAVLRGRCVFLDGLRGWGAVVVLVYHYLVQVFPPNQEAASILSRVIFLNGNMAVWVFFVVSGFSLSIRYIRRRDGRALTRLAIGRYPRLAIPILAACCVVHLMMVSGLIYPASQRIEILRPLLAFEPTVSHLFRFSLFDVFFDHRLLDSYIPPLWTMSIELIGSAAVIALLAIFGRVKWRLWVYTPVMLVLMAFDSFYALFVAGVLLAELYASGVAAPRWFRGLLAACWCGGLLVPVLSNSVNPLGLLGIAAWCAAWIFLLPLRQLLEMPVSRWLGRISFPLYLMHAPVLYSFSLHLLRQVNGFGVSPAFANLIVVAMSLPVAILAAWLFTPVNDFATRFSRWLGNLVVDGWDSVYRQQKLKRLRPSFD